MDEIALVTSVGGAGGAEGGTSNLAAACLAFRVGVGAGGGGGGPASNWTWALKDNRSGPGGVALIGGDHVVCAQSKGTALNVWSWGKGEGVQLKCHAPERISVVACSKDGAWCVGGARQSGRVHLWEVASGRLLRVWDAHYTAITAISFSCDGGFVLTGGQDGGVGCWNLYDLLYDGGTPPIPVWTAAHHTLPLTGLHVTTSGRVYTCSLDRTARVYEGSGPLCHSVTAREQLRTLVCDPGENKLFLGGGGGTIYALDLSAASAAISDALPELHGHLGPVAGLACTLDGASLISCGEDGTARTWDIASCQCIRVLELFSPQAGASSVVVLPLPQGLRSIAPPVGLSSLPLAAFKKFPTASETAESSGPRVVLRGSVELPAARRPAHGICLKSQQRDNPALLVELDRLRQESDRWASINNELVQRLSRK